MDASSPEVMLTFYQQLYPFQSIFNWLNHEHTPSRLFTHREFVFTLQNDVYLRYNSFNTHEELKKQVCQYNPSRFEIGPVYSARPRDKNTVRAGSFQPIQRELVFDIDMTDYDPIRTCCSGADICKRCWVFIAAAVRVIDSGIRTQYGYQKLLWVYSGRRGIHLWISDKEAMDLTDDQRKAIVGWFTVIQDGGKESSKKLHLRQGGTLPPPLKAALNHLSPIFDQLILKDQNSFGSEESHEIVLELIPDAKVVKTLRESWSKDPSRSSADKWMDIKREIVQYNEKSEKRHTLMAALEDIIFHYTYPRLDAAVSKSRKHLLKAPFCVHPKTGRVCVPVDPERIEMFDPEKVPTVGQLLKELDSIGLSNGDSQEKPDWRKTSLKRYVDYLDNYVLGLMDEVRREKRQANDHSLSW